jgi:anti-sigma factor ChrR (cupin superfamily)
MTAFPRGKSAGALRSGSRCRLLFQAALVVAFLLSGCARGEVSVPSLSAVAAAVTVPPEQPDGRPCVSPGEDVMNPIVLKDALTNIDTLERTLDWQPFREGVQIARICSSPDNGPSTAFLKYQSGASVPQHTHAGYEHIFILKGSQVDRSGEHGPGTVIINPPGSSHKVMSPGGCIVMIIWDKPVILA